MKFIPHAYQRYCINRAITDEALGLLLDMGLGKTAIVLTAINDLKYNRFQVRKVLIIAPKKVAEATWQKEAAKWDHLKLLRIVTVLGTKQQRIRALNTQGDIYIINRDNVQFIVDYYRNAWPFDMLVVDESSSFKNHEAKRFKALTWVRPHIKRVINLTGTPAPNSLLDIWAQLYLLDQGERLGKQFGSFRTRYFDKNEYTRRYTAKRDAHNAIMDKISDICVSMKAEDYIELPDCIDVDHPVKLDAKAQKAYDIMERDMLLEVEEDMIDAGSAAVLTGKLLQLCNGAVYCADDTGTRKVVHIHDCKIELFLELVEQLNGKPALVFYNFQHDLERISKALNGSGLRVRKLSGAADQEAWNNHEIDILLAHPASCAYGLNLQQGGNHVIWFGLNWSLELYQQAIARLHRQGQTEKVFNHRLVVVGGVDEDVIAALADKGETQERLMQALKARIEGVKSK